MSNTIDLILENPKSFCRYGDGEFLLINGGTHFFQPYNKNLTQRLIEILESPGDKCYIGLPGDYFKAFPPNTPLEGKSFLRQSGSMVRSTILKYCNRKRLYIETGFTARADVAAFNSDGFHEKYIKRLKELFRGRNLVIFSGQTIFDKIKYNVFEFAASRTHVFANSIDAWSQYKEIMATARRFPKENSTLCFILGPTATVVAYDLAQEGYMAWDIGHLAKTYDAYMKYLENDLSPLNNFFAAD